MRAISVRQPWASAIAAGTKTIEYRRWKTAYRGPLLIVASKRPVIDGLPSGAALGVVELIDCLWSDAEGCWTWLLGNARPVAPFPVHGQLGLFAVPLPDELKGEETDD